MKNRAKKPARRTKLANWGTKAQAKINERKRAYENRIFELEKQVVLAQHETQVVCRQRDELENKLLRQHVQPRFVEALRQVCLVSIWACEQLGIADHVLVLCVWLAQLEGQAAQLASGNQEVRAS